MIILRGENDYLGGRDSAETCARLGGGAARHHVRRRRNQGRTEVSVRFSFAGSEMIRTFAAP